MFNSLFMLVAEICLMSNSSKSAVDEQPTSKWSMKPEAWLE